MLARVYGWQLAGMLVLVWFGGAYFALVVRALVADASQRRLCHAAELALTGEQLAHLREYIKIADEHERALRG
jgi:hypothetical protein